MRYYQVEFGKIREDGLLHKSLEKFNSYFELDEAIKEFDRKKHLLKNRKDMFVAIESYSTQFDIWVGTVLIWKS